MTAEQQAQAILEAFLGHAVFDGWRIESLSRVETELQLAPGTAYALFPGGITDVLNVWHEMINARMAEGFLEQVSPTFRTRDKISLAVMTRLAAMRPYRDAVRQACGYYALPQHWLSGEQYIFSVCDRIWRLAGDSSTDYNYYTKRILLAAVYRATLLVWLQDASEEQVETRDFLERRLADVLKIPTVFSKWRLSGAHA